MPRGVPYSAAQRDTVLRARGRRATLAECARLAGVSSKTVSTILKLARERHDERAAPLTLEERGALISAGVRRSCSFAERSARGRRAAAARGAAKHDAPAAPSSLPAAGPLHRDQHGENECR